nr:hypothetical protein [Enterococcus faecium]
MQQFFNITLPLVTPTLFFVVVTTAVSYSHLTLPTLSLMHI